MVASHVILSLPVIKKFLINRLGKRGFYSGHSVVSLAAFWFLVTSYQSAGYGDQILLPVENSRWVALLLMPVVFILISVRFFSKVRNNNSYSIYRVTNYAGSLAICFWAILHILNTGDEKRVILFSAMMAIALLTVVKFFIINSDRLSDSKAFEEIFRDVGYMPLFIGVVIYFLFLFVHEYLFGVDPLFILSLVEVGLLVSC